MGLTASSAEDGTGFCAYGQKRLAAALEDSLETSRGTESFLRGTWFYKILSARCQTSRHAPIGSVRRRKISPSTQKVSAIT